MSYLSRTLVAVGVLGLATAVTIPAAQAEQGDWLLRGGATLVSPKSDNLKFDTGDIGAGVLVLNVKDATSFGFNVAYMVTDNIGIELLAAAPFKHDIDAKVQGESGSAELGDVKHLPPTLSLQYYFIPDGKFSPYVGLGVNWTIFSSENLDSEFVAVLEGEGLMDPCLSLDDSFGLALQAGADFRFGDSWFLNADIRWINIETRAKISATVDGADGVVPLGTVKIDPIVYSLMLGYRF